jgi:hypothetical protein
MSGRVFSISLDDVTFAKLGDLKKRYPELSRNGMIRYIINLTHSGEYLDLEGQLDLVRALRAQIAILKGGKKR